MERPYSAREYLPPPCSAAICDFVLCNYGTFPVPDSDVSYRSNVLEHVRPVAFQNTLNTSSLLDPSLDAGENWWNFLRWRGTCPHPEYRFAVRSL